MFGLRNRRDAQKKTRAVSRRTLKDTQRKLKLEKAILTRKAIKINRALAELDAILTGGTAEVPADEDEAHLWTHSVMVAQQPLTLLV
jgi:hypothetical protein